MAHLSRRFFTPSPCAAVSPSVTSQKRSIVAAWALPPFPLPYLYFNSFRVANLKYFCQQYANIFFCLEDSSAVGRYTVALDKLLAPFRRAIFLIFKFKQPERAVWSFETSVSIYPNFRFCFSLSPNRHGCAASCTVGDDVTDSRWRFKAQSAVMADCGNGWLLATSWLVVKTKYVSPPAKLTKKYDVKTKIAGQCCRH